MHNTFTKLALNLIASPHLLERVRFSHIMVELLETDLLEPHVLEILFRRQMLALINACTHHPHAANAHSLLEIVDFYDKHFITSETELALAA